jgi:hypothetical protein
MLEAPKEQEQQAFMAKHGATRRSKPPEPEVNAGHRLIGGGILAAAIGGILMFGGGHPRDTSTPEEQPEPQTITYTAPSPGAVTMAPSYTVASRGQAEEQTERFVRTEPREQPPEIKPLEAEDLVTPAVIDAPAPQIEIAASTEPAVTVPEEMTAEIGTINTKPAAAKNSPLPTFVSRNKATGSETWHVGEHDYTLDKSTVQAFEKHAKARNWPKEMFIAACARESRCDASAENINIVTNKKTGKKTDLSTHACGLFQLMPTENTQTLWRLAYEYGAANGHPEMMDLIVRSKKPQTDDEIKAKKPATLVYHPKDKEARTQVMALCKNADFNTGLFAQDKSREITTYENWLGNREISLGELVFVNNLGVGRMQRFAQQAWDDKKYQHDKGHQDMMARAFFGKAISNQNPSLVEFPGKGVPYVGKDGKTHYRKDMTVRESYNSVINNFGGWKSPSTVLSMNLENN